MDNLKFVGFFIFLFCFAPIQAQDCIDKIIIGERFKIHSSIYNKERTITVGLPPNYNPQKKYPVLYMLDGLAQYSIGAIDSRLNFVELFPI